ncbi:MAG: AhpC/TSA family protein [Catalinimonas sp.]
MNKEHRRLPAWIPRFLTLAGGYNLFWGIFMLFNPQFLLDWIAVGSPLLPPLVLKLLGLPVALLGLGFLAAAWRPLRFVGFVAWGAAAKLLGGAFALYVGYHGGFTEGLLQHVAANDAIWIVPLAVAWYQSFREKWNPRVRRPEGTLKRVLACYRTSHRRNLASLTFESPVLLVFLRHLGSTFARETTDHIVKHRRQIEASGVQVIFVHLSIPRDAAAFFRRRSYADAEHCSDPEGRLYETFELSRGHFFAVFGPVVWAKLLLARLRGYGLGRVRGDAFRMPGAFLLSKGGIIQAFRPRRVSDRTDYSALSARGGAPTTPVPVVATA